MELLGQSAKPSALSDWAYETIKEAILNLRVAPGAQLHVESLAEQMSTSRTPVREALLRLEGDGLVRTVPRIGFFVTEITRRDLQEVLELRELLESYATRNAVPLLTDEDLARIDQLFETAVTAVEEGKLDLYLEMDTAFHSLLIERADNSRMIATMESLRNLIRRERALSVRSPENVHETIAEHQRIMEALHRRDGESAGRLMGEHLRAVARRLLRLVDLNRENATSIA